MTLLPSIKRLGLKRSTAAAVYELADSKLPLEEGGGEAGTPSRSCCKLPDVSQVLHRIEWFGSVFVSIPLLIASLTLSCVFFGVVLFGVDGATLGSKYGFRPLSDHSYSAWGTAMFVVVPTLWTPMFLVCYISKHKAGRWMHYFVAAAYLAVIIVANVLGAAETHSREAVEPQFVAKFNEFYCDSRTLHQCLQGGQADTLTLVGRGNATLLDATANKTEGVLSVWTRCRQVVLKAVTGHSYEVQTGTDSYSNAGGDADNAALHKAIYLSTFSIDNLIKEVQGSRETDEWCANAFARHRSTPLSDAEQRAAPAPYALNPDLYTAYVDEWPRRLRYSNGLLGSAVGCMVLAAVSWKVARSAAENL